MRLDKYLAHAGVGTRKEVKKLIRSKAVTVMVKLLETMIIKLMKQGMKCLCMMNQYFIKSFIMLC